MVYGSVVIIALTVELCVQMRLRVNMDSYKITYVPQYLFQCKNPKCGHYFIGTEQKRQCSKCGKRNEGIKLGN